MSINNINLIDVAILIAPLLTKLALVTHRVKDLELSRRLTLPHRVLLWLVEDGVFVFNLFTSPIALLKFDFVEPGSYILARQPSLFTLALDHELCMQLARLVVIAVNLAAPVAELQ